MPQDYSYTKYLSQYLPTTAQSTDDQCKSDLNMPYCKMAPLPGSAIGFNAMAELSQAVNLDIRRNATYSNTTKSALGYNELDLSSSDWGKTLQNTYPIKAFYTTCSSTSGSTIPCNQTTYQNQFMALKNVMGQHPLT
jgi:hypothetical protein